MHDDEQRKKLLQQLVNRPETLSSMDVAPETDDSAEMAIEDPSAAEAPVEEQYEVPEDITDGVNQAVDASDGMISQSPRHQYASDPAIMELMKKLKSGQQINEDQDVEVEPETIEDPSASPDLRKAALEKVKQKYLGR